jgi:hypothetical protein
VGNTEDYKRKTEKAEKHLLPDCIFGGYGERNTKRSRPIGRVFSDRWGCVFVFPTRSRHLRQLNLNVFSLDKEKNGSRKLLALQKGPMTTVNALELRMADAPGVHLGGHDEYELAHEAVLHQQDGEEELIAAKIAQVAYPTVEIGLSLFELLLAPVQARLCFHLTRPRRGDWISLPLLTRAPCQQLDSSDPQVVAAAAEVLFSRSHVSHPSFAENKERMRRMGAIAPLCRGLHSEAWPVQYHACSALSELAFCNKSNCKVIITTPGALDALVNILLSNVMNMREDAALVINNCAAFSEEVCMPIVQSKGMIAALKKLATSGSFDAKCVAVGALNCLSRCKEARPILVEMRVVEDALVPVLREEGAGDKHEARKVRASMVIANLTGRCDAEHVQDYEALPAMVMVLGYALDGRSWAGIHLSAYSVLYPLSHLSQEPGNRPHLMDSGIVGLLARSLDRWSAGARANADELTLPLVLSISEQLCQNWDNHVRIRQSGLVRGLREVARGFRGEAAECVQMAQMLLQRLLLAPIAVCMGQHSRLGINSPFFRLDEYITALIIDLSFDGPQSSWVLCHRESDSSNTQRSALDQ